MLLSRDEKASGLRQSCKCWSLVWVSWPLPPAWRRPCHWPWLGVVTSRPCLETPMQKVADANLLRIQELLVKIYCRVESVFYGFLALSTKKIYEKRLPYWLLSVCFRYKCILRFIPIVNIRWSINSVGAHHIRGCKTAEWHKIFLHETLQTQICQWVSLTDSRLKLRDSAHLSGTAFFINWVLLYTPWS